MHKSDKALYAALGIAQRSDRGLCYAITAPPGSRLSRTRFERITLKADVLPGNPGVVLGLLLDTAPSADNLGCPVLEPIWAEEAMHRAYSMVRLFGRQVERERGYSQTDCNLVIDCALARSLASAYRSLADVHENDIVPCSSLLRQVVLDLNALFGNANIIVKTDVDRVSLPAYKRRALVLCTSELLTNALTHAFRDHAGGRIDVSLRRLDSKWGLLRVADNGGGFRGRLPNTKLGVAGGLASLLEAELDYYRTDDRTTVAEIAFPL